MFNKSIINELNFALFKVLKTRAVALCEEQKSLFTENDPLNLNSRISFVWFKYAHIQTWCIEWPAVSLMLQWKECNFFCILKSQWNILSNRNKM